MNFQQGFVFLVFIEQLLFMTVFWKFLQIEKGYE